ncbi:hypothetical protein Tco_0827064, partial [Tanacetum coccineum]
MTPLPPRDQRHLWLRYQVEGYTKEIVHDFEQRLEVIFRRQVNRVHTLDFEGLTPDMRQDLAKRLRMAPKKVTVTDLFYLRSMDQWAVNVPYLLVQYLFRHVKGRKSGAKLSRGHFIRHLAHHFGLVSDDGLRGLSIGAERQPVVVATAPGDAKDALDIDEVAKILHINGTFRGSYPEVFERRTKRRTDSASTSTAQQDEKQPDL